MDSSLVKGSLGCWIKDYQNMIYSGSIVKPLIGDPETCNLNGMMEAYKENGFKFKVKRLRPLDLSFMLTYTYTFLETNDVNATRLVIESMYEIMSTYAYEQSHPTKELVYDIVHERLSDGGYYMLTTTTPDTLYHVYDLLSETFEAVGEGVFFNSTFVGWEEDLSFILGES